MPNSISSTVDHWLSDNARWYILAVCILLSYGYIFYAAYRGLHDNDEEDKQTAYLLLPQAGGYNVVRGDTSSPSLFEWNWQEYVLLTIAILFTIGLIWYSWFNKKTSQDSLVMGIQFILLWFHSVAFLFFLPVNAFHKRVLYNTRSMLVQIVNQPERELFLTFLFVVLLPLPNARNSTYTDRMSWLSLKLGVFYVLQNILLGNPNYRIEPYTDGRILPESRSDMIHYGFFIMLLFVVYVGYQFHMPKK
jgi:hypothetical protein